MPPQQEQRVERRLAAIFAADVAGYSRLMRQDEAGTLRALSCGPEMEIYVGRRYRQMCGQRQSRLRRA